MAMHAPTLPRKQPTALAEVRPYGSGGWLRVDLPVELHLGQCGDEARCRSMAAPAAIEHRPARGDIRVGKVAS